MAQTSLSRRLQVWSTPFILATILLIFVLVVGWTGEKSLARMAAETLVRVTLVVGLWIPLTFSITKAAGRSLSSTRMYSRKR